MVRLNMTITEEDRNPYGIVVVDRGGSSSCRRATGGPAEVRAAVTGCDDLVDDDSVNGATGTRSRPDASGLDFPSPRDSIVADDTGRPQ